MIEGIASRCFSLAVLAILFAVIAAAHLLLSIGPAATMLKALVIPAVSAPWVMPKAMLTVPNQNGTTSKMRVRNHLLVNNRNKIGRGKLTVR